MTSSDAEVVTELLPLLRVYKDGTVERLLGSPYVPPSPEDPATGVSSKDIIISPEVGARIYLPMLSCATAANKKLPILVYFHGGGFCIESAYSSSHHRYLNSIVSQAKAIAVSVEYRLAPEHPLPAAYEDCWAALQWVASHSVDDPNFDKDPWLINHGDFNKLFIGGDSTGGNIVHNMAIRAGVEPLNGDVKIVGGFLSHPSFWGSEPIWSESSQNSEQKSLLNNLWAFVYPSAPGGLDSPAINPFAEDAPSLSQLGCSTLFVCVAEKDVTKNGGIRYAQAVRESGWKGKVELLEIEGEDHCFHVFFPDTENAKNLIKRLASFICSEKESV